MFHDQRVVVVMPAYNAVRTLERTVREIPMDLVDEIVVTDDASSDGTVAEAERLGLRPLIHTRNRGYGANQKTCYQEALRRGADIVVMLHPDYQYTPKLIPAMVGLLAKSATGRTPVVAAVTAGLVATVGVGLPLHGSVLVATLAGMLAGQASARVTPRAVEVSS